MATTRKTKAKARTKSKSTAQPVRTKKGAATANTTFEKTGVIIFTVLALYFLVLAVTNYM